MYSKWLKSISFISMVLAGCVLFIGLIGFSIMDSSTNYFESYEFREALISKAGYVRDWIVRYNEPTIFTKVTQEEINKYRKRDGGGLSNSEAKEGIIADRKNYYSKIQNELVTDNKNIDYFAVNTQTEQVITNMNVEEMEEAISQLSKRPNHLVGNGYYILSLKYGSDQEGYYYSDSYINDTNYYAGNEFVGQDNYRIYVGLKEVLEEGDAFFTSYKDFIIRKESGKKFLQIGLIALLIGIVFFIYWVIVVGKDEKKSEIKLQAFEQVPLEIQLALSFIVMHILVDIIRSSHTSMLVEEIINAPKAVAYTYNMVELMTLLGGLISTIGIGLLCVSSFIKHLKKGSFLEYIWIIKACKTIYYSQESKRKLLVQVGIMIVANIFIDLLIILTSDFYNSNFYIVIRPIIWNVFWGIIILKFALDYRKVVTGAKDIMEGKLDKKIELEKTLPMLTELATSINSIGTGLEKAVGESIKSERLKTELITNVSHDLKTPLTSIISYIDLLKAEQIENETAREYIEVLDERSHRLKQLVEDLVEASKAVTGNLKANLEILRFDELVGQAIGEYLDRMEASNLTLVYHKMEETWVLADGRHMWRVIENLFSNVCKYAMPQTRVYIEMYEEEGYSYCTIKNISKDLLNIDPNELTERFVRGDTSRTTEGSGLGLAIAQSLIILQGGSLEIRIDGDLFKVIVKMPIAKKETITLEKGKS